MAARALMLNIAVSEVEDGCERVVTNDSATNSNLRFYGLLLTFPNLSRMAALPGEIFVFHRLRLSIEHHVRVSIVKSIYTSLFVNRAILTPPE